MIHERGSDVPERAHYLLSALLCNRIQGHAGIEQQYQLFQLKHLDRKTRFSIEVRTFEALLKPEKDLVVCLTPQKVR